MTALALPSRTNAAPVPVAQPPSEWLPIGEAARLLGRGEGAMRVDCLRHLAPRGLAKKLAGSNGRASWCVHRSAYPELLRSHTPALAGEGHVPALTLISAAPKHKRDAASIKAMYLARFRAWRTRSGVAIRRDYPAWSAATARELGMKSTPSLTRIYAWHDQCPITSDLNGMIAALLDARGGAHDLAAAVSPDAWGMFEGLYLTAAQRSLASCWRDVCLVAPAKGWTWPGLSRCRELVAERIPPSRADFHRLGASAWAKSHQTPIEQDPEAFQAGECWESDHSNLDFFARELRGGKWVAVRPWLTAWFDRRSRLLCGWHLSTEHNSATIRIALHHAFRCGHSIPRFAWLDNGKDFAGSQLHGRTKAQRRAAKGRGEESDQERQCKDRGLLGMLGIEAHFAVPYNHNGKARIERFFGIVHEGFDKTFTSYCGSRPGMVDKDALDKALADVMTLPTIDEAAEEFARWAAAYNTNAERRVPDLDGLSPLEFYARNLPARRIAEEGSLGLLALEWAQPRKVSKRGVAMTIGDRTYRYGGGHPMLEPLVGTDAEVLIAYDPRDVQAVKVFDPTGRFLCDAAMNPLHGGVSRDPVRKAALTEAQRIRREQERLARRKPEISVLLLSDLERAALAQRDAEAASEMRRIKGAAGGPSDAPLKLVQTPLDGQSKAVHAAAQETAELRELAADQHEDELLDLDEMLVEEAGSAVLAGPIASGDPDDDDFFEDEDPELEEGDDFEDEPQPEDDDFFEDDDSDDDAPGFEPGSDDCDFDETDLADLEPAQEALP